MGLTRMTRTQLLQAAYDEYHEGEWKYDKSTYQATLDVLVGLGYIVRVGFTDWVLTPRGREAYASAVSAAGPMWQAIMMGR